jgi:hypothetical protein
MGSLDLESLGTPCSQIYMHDEVVCYVQYIDREAILQIIVAISGIFYSGGSAIRTEFESETLILGETKCAKLFT